jgi:tetratricopeptide (TPR) repeat protein
VLDGLESLVDKSLVDRIAGEGEVIRFAMLETIREYAAERLNGSADASRVRSMHAAFYRDLAQAAEPHLTGPDSDTWLARLTAEVPNLRAALRWAIDSGDAGAREAGLLTAGALWRFWQVTGSLREAATWFAELLSSAETAATPARAKALQGSAGIAYWQHDMVRSREQYEESVAVFRGLGDKPGLAAALNDLAYLPMMGGEVALARQLFTEARDLFRELGDSWQATLAEMNIGNTHFFAGDHDAARTTYEALIPAIRERGDRFWLTEAVTGMGQLEQMTGHPEAARPYYAESLQLALDAGTVPQVAMVLEPFSNVESALGNHRRAVELWSAAQAIKDRAGGGAPAEIMQTVDPRPDAVQAIGQDAVDEAWAFGQGMSLSEAVARALDDTRGSNQPTPSTGPELPHG